MLKILVEIELDVNTILFKEDIEPKIKEWLKKLKINYLTEKKVRNIIFMER